MKLKIENPSIKNEIVSNSHLTFPPDFCAACAGFEFGASRDAVAPNRIVRRMEKINAEENVAEFVVLDGVATRFQQNARVFGLQIAAAFFNLKTANNAIVSRYGDDASRAGSPDRRFFDSFER